jgi:hypothetical protein
MTERTVTGHILTDTRRITHRRRLEKEAVT